MLGLKLLQVVLLRLSPFVRAFLSQGGPGAYEVNGQVYHCDKVISRDISIVGGGAAGTYAAVRLQDLGKTVLLIEKTNRLGGNTQTYVSQLLHKVLSLSKACMYFRDRPPAP